ncbi:hypothetical protein BPO_0574 [Bergeyella porcorum]|uniref:Uncharacterized protein n=2 Tax=Bergeyella porcorum TaxID=1735111 RepID=A0AAU0F0Y1_9FLAO
MNAYIQNKCESEFLKIAKEISDFLDVEIEILTEPLENGGIKRIFKIIEKKGKEYPLISALMIGVMANVISDPISDIWKNNDLEELQKENLKKQNRNLDEEYKIYTKILVEKDSIRKKVSNFYETLNGESKIQKVSYQIYNNENDNESNEIFINKSEFSKFILPSNDLAPIELEDQIIEIISPNLKGGKYKWKGIYNKEIISFSMKSKEFNRLIKQGRVEFKNGSSIKCDIDIERVLDEEGQEKVKSLNVIRVIEFFESDIPFETPEGKKKREQREVDKQQLKFDFGDDYN